MAEKRQYYCEKCGEPVSESAKRCPHCGRVFYAVRCPNCNFTGNAELFVSGCPLCGYHITGKERPAPSGNRKKDRKWFYRVAAVLLGSAIIFFFILYFRM